METPGMSVREQFRLKRERGKVWIHKIGVTQLAEGIILLILGTVTLIYGAPNDTFVIYVGTPIWTALVILPAGILGIMAGRLNDLEGCVINPSQKKLIVGNYVLTIISWTPAIMTVVYGAIAYSWCESPPDDYSHACVDNHPENLSIAVINIVVGTAVILISVPFAVFYCYYGRAFGIRVNNTFAEPDPLVEEQMRHQATIIEQQQAEIAQLAQRQQAMEKQLSARSSVPEEAPPPYDEPIVEKSHP